MIFAITTLGCKVNQYESQLLREALTARGHREQPFGSPGADVSIVNTCTVTHRSDAQGRNLLRRALALGGRVIATGCQAKVYGDALRALSPAVEVIPFEDIGPALDIQLPSRITGFCGHSRAFVNIQQGCGNFCTYCIVPHARGVPRSRPWQEVIGEITGLYAAGFREVVLSGINIGLYEGGLAALLEKILKETPMPAVRISSIEPWTLTGELIRLVVEEPRVCRHLHIPVQSGSDAILSRMGRPYDARYFRSLVEKIKALNPGVSIGTDVMVGFPGEGENEFGQTRSLLEEADISYLHVFPYSPRPGTPAAGWGDTVDPRAVKERVALLRELSRRKRDAFVLSRIGMEEDLLVTRAGRHSFRGVTSNYLTVEAQGKARVNDRVSVILEEPCGGYVLGRAIG
ncbi:MAG: MiaB/RimO family radical SAM methylthiotransferase [Desulfomonilia bacterium]|jgi:threonylcarbamoyladenosine tRNA methylthiotransferase MtaB|uniref:Threonylcarbamoyladenosine tRNA methylthiotransferase MtaB n=1 Tax=anaerobic digester metagenome TaxID=1263854 RepID=A0A485M1H7_9ZZZZ|nr:MiaB/RimO family radical SAM methylthiotransferase [Pseudomonadota bacterium]HON39173.1 MiaB/RimO family radical SAM methylthiotransferase [Deltaproteobacteria bacterium]HPD21319.1 MiaB/RimO family radical SAM methylthiotransferase [Deltaproteobacteria bacterium]HRS56043.1 MiaB/RimO family radical SAM methylthiotransferase [Desulfomonilia bacterium]HRV36748.1 MiaB/RimO family radical SAM methylthiotransferase [Desulfomonilia bacterium]